MSVCRRIVRDSGDTVYLSCASITKLECHLSLFHPVSNTCWEYFLGADDLAASQDEISIEKAFARLQARFEPWPDDLVEACPDYLTQFIAGKGMLTLFQSDTGQNMTLYLDAVDTPSSVLCRFLDASLDVQHRAYERAKALEKEKQEWKSQLVEQQEHMAQLTTQCARTRTEIFGAMMTLLNDKKHEIEKLASISHRRDSDTSEEECRDGDDSDQTQDDNGASGHSDNHGF